MAGNRKSRRLSSVDEEEKEPRDTLSANGYETIEEGISSEDFKANPQKNKRSRLSTVSRKYNVTGTGELDSAELMMRKMDKSNRGYLSNEQVHKVVREQIHAQKELVSSDYSQLTSWVM